VGFAQQRKCQVIAGGPMSDEIKDITLEVLISIRDEIKKLRDDVNIRFEKMEARFERMENELSEIKINIKAIVAHFDRDYLKLATEMDQIRQRLYVCEERLNIQPTN
jgi:predicted  nucleic acid-binding Zn-ribbon protein